MLIDRSDYPRPLLYRAAHTNLNGEWDFAFDDEQTGLAAGWANGFPAQRRIRVPFSYETKASGIGDPSVHPAVWYQKRLDTSAIAPDETLLVHFEGVDYRAAVFANGKKLCEHTGGYARFSVDLAPALPADEVLLVVLCLDSLSKEQPRGKQRYRPESWGCWYVQTTGIWKTVWAERVSRTHMTDLSVVPLPERGAVRLLASIDGGAASLFTAIYADGEPVAFADASEWTVTEDGYEAELSVPAPRPWSPEDPFLYEVKAVLTRDGAPVDTVWSYFGFRTVSWDQHGLYLNGRRTFLRFVLDQGYWPDSGLTPPDLAALHADLDAVLRYGYNGVRKHQKIEDARFLYACDARGVLVFSEMAAAYAYSDDAEAEFLREWEAAVRQHKQHPSILAWVPFNESWGIGDVATDRQQQRFTETVYRLTKALDPMRPVVSNDGWEHTVSDLVTVHDYRETGAELLALHGDGDARVLSGELSYSWYGQKLFANGYAYQNQPMLLSEYGGIAFRTADGWGYGDPAEDEQAFLTRFLSQNEAIAAMPQYSGFCYTQLTDVEQEKNGLLRADRSEKLSEAGVARVRASNLSFGDAR